MSAMWLDVASHRGNSSHPGGSFVFVLLCR